MKKTKVFNLLSLIFNLAIVVCFAILFIFGIKETGDVVKFFKPFSNISSTLLAFACLIYIPVNIANIKKGKNATPVVVELIKFIATVSIIVTMVTVLAFIGPTQGFDEVFEGTKIIPHLICPILALITFVVFEGTLKLRFVSTFAGILPIVIYGVIYLIMVKVKNAVDFYGFNSGAFTGKGVFVLIAFVLGAFALSVALWLLHKCFAVVEPEQNEETSEEENDEEIDIEEVEDEEKEVENEKTEETVEEKEEMKQPEEKKTTAKKSTKPATKNGEKPNNLYKDKSRVYHITRNSETGRWNVKLGNGEKVIKTFDTQKEGIDYAKALVKTQGGSIRIHSVKGRIRK